MPSQFRITRRSMILHCRRIMTERRPASRIVGRIGSASGATFPCAASVIYPLDAQRPTVRRFNLGQMADSEMHTVTRPGTAAPTWPKQVATGVRCVLRLPVADDVHRSRPMLLA